MAMLIRMNPADIAEAAMIYCLRSIYKPLKNTLRVPSEAIKGSNTIYLPPEEITGEFLGELKAIEQGVATWLGLCNST